MKARFDSKCRTCGEPIVKGKEIAQNTQGIWVHKYCSDANELPDLP